MISENTNQAKINIYRQRLAAYEEKSIEAEVERRFLMLFNDLVDAKGNVFSLNEPAIAGLIKDLDDHISIRNDGYWLTLARINELTLLCTENYANNCEFSLVGDLLINPRVEVKTPALLPELFKKLKCSGRFDREYLTALDQRKSRIVDLIGFLASAGFTDIVSLRTWLKSASPADRKLMESRFCPLDFGWFLKWGRKIRQWGNTVSNSSN
jgi:hypothetical protein